MIATSDPEVFIEQIIGDSTIYRRLDGLRWKVTGRCERLGHCLVGAVIDGVTIKSVEHLNQLCEEAGRDRIDSELDVPVGPNFRGCCPFIITVLNGN